MKLPETVAAIVINCTYAEQTIAACSVSVQKRRFVRNPLAVALQVMEINLFPG
jgi:hypothetical protein